MTFGCGDRVKHRPSGEEHVVACSHDAWLHTVGYPERRLMVESCELVEAAGEADRLAMLKAMAQSTGAGHRPACARRKLAELEGAAGVGSEYCGC